jgi:hypothetical protein
MPKAFPRCFTTPLIVGGRRSPQKPGRGLAKCAALAGLVRCSVPVVAGGWQGAAKKPVLVPRMSVYIQANATVRRPKLGRTPGALLI